MKTFTPRDDLGKTDPVERRAATAGVTPEGVRPDEPAPHRDAGNLSVPDKGAFETFVAGAGI
jgi:hypothetical protein